jgi:hypothetical protein
VSGGDYWFIYKNVLFIDLNSNAFRVTATSVTDPTWRTSASSRTSLHSTVPMRDYTVLVYHHRSTRRGTTRTTATPEALADFPTAFSQLGVDLVLQGHDHSYRAAT